MKIGLYLHVPFCHAKCHYCDFLSFAQHTQKEGYVEALIKEMKSYQAVLPKNHQIQTIFIGGGTPTVLSPFWLEKIGEAIKDNFSLANHVEWSIEANPGTITEGHVRAFKNMGVNRVSLGLQAIQPHLLKKLGRIHTFSEWQQSVAWLLEAGITNINTDLMFGLPDQTPKDWQETLNQITAFPITHLSVYSLIIEEDTLFSKWYQQDKLNLPDEVSERQMYETAKHFLAAQGFEQYEISNWAKPGFACSHNIGYWQLRPYIGLGLGAHSYFSESRYHNTENFKAYLAADGNLALLQQEKTEETVRFKMEEFMFLGLRMTQGISKDAFFQLFKKELDEVYEKELAKWIKEGLLIQNKDRIYFSERGVALSNQVLSSFLQD